MLKQKYIVKEKEKSYIKIIMQIFVFSQGLGVGGISVI